MPLPFEMRKFQEKIRDETLISNTQTAKVKDKERREEEEKRKKRLNENNYWKVFWGRSI